jgi:hypothetical protein
MECHTADSAQGSPVPIDTTKLFLGNKQFPAAGFGLPVPPFPAIIYSLNLTPTIPNGIGGWTPTMVKNTIKQGIDKDGLPLCPPMPFGPNGAFGGITDSDAIDIGYYLTTLPPVDNGAIPICHPPTAPEGGTDAAPDAPSDATGQ